MSGRNDDALSCPVESCRANAGGYCAIDNGVMANPSLPSALGWESGVLSSGSQLNAYVPPHAARAARVNGVGYWSSWRSCPYVRARDHKR